MQQVMAVLAIKCLMHRVVCLAQQALALWPSCVATGLRLGSPATSSFVTDPTGWFAQFWEAVRMLRLRSEGLLRGACHAGADMPCMLPQITAKGYKQPDFIAVHWVSGQSLRIWWS